MSFEKKWLYGYAVFPCFKVRTLENGESAELICNGFLSWVFDWFVSPFWDGAIVVTGEAIEKWNRRKDD